MSRRRCWLAAGVGLCLLLPASASAHARAGAQRAGKAQVVAVGRHGHLVWLSHSAWLRSRGSLTLSRIPRFSRVAPRIVSSQPTITVTGLQFYCDIGDYADFTSDSIAWVESYAPSLYSDMLTCQTNDGRPVLAHQENPYPSCYNPFAQSVQRSPCEQAHFADGEAIVISNVPDDNGSGGSNANASPYTFYKQGFSCGAVAGVGSDDNTVYRAKTSDSIEFFQNYVDYNGNPTQAITTSCLGQLPSSVTVDSSTAVAHFIACYQYNPNPGGPNLLGYGETVTYPDRQYSETCTTPNYHPAVAPPA